MIFVTATIFHDNEITLSSIEYDGIENDDANNYWLCKCNEDGNIGNSMLKEITTII